MAPTGFDSIFIKYVSDTVESVRELTNPTDTPIAHFDHKATIGVIAATISESSRSIHVPHFIMSFGHVLAVLGRY